MKKVLWIGPLAHPSEVNNSKAISAAANVWQLGFIDGLIENNVTVIVLSYIPQQTWPIGPIWAPKQLNSISKSGLIQYQISYLNIKYIRGLWITASIVLLTLSKLKLSKDSVVFTYNPLPDHRIPATILRSILKTKWISILADALVKGKPDMTLFLSYDYYSRYNSGEKYFLDGGITQKRNQFYNKSDNAKKVILYAGTQSRITGIDEFIDLFLELEDQSYELHIYGKGHNKKLIIASEKDPRIKLFGFVSDDILEKACSSAYAFINPRPSNTEANNTFPSKLLLYLSYNRPILCTDAPGISHKYDQTIFKYDNDDFNSLKNCLFTIEKAEQSTYAANMQKFLLENSWQNLVGNFINYIAKRFNLSI